MKFRCRIGFHKWTKWIHERIYWSDVKQVGWQEHRYCVLCDKRDEGGYG